MISQDGRVWTPEGIELADKTIGTDIFPFPRTNNKTAA